MNKPHLNSMLLVKYIIAIFCAISVTSCNTDDYFEYLSSETELDLYVSGFVSNDSIYVCLTYTQPNNYRGIYGPEVYIPVITDSTAIVTIYENDVFFCTLDNRTIFETDYSNSKAIERPKYYFVSYKAVTANCEYTVSIKHNSFGTIEATTLMPENGLNNITSTNEKRQSPFRLDSDNWILDSDIWIDSLLWNEDFSVELDAGVNENNFYMFTFLNLYYHEGYHFDGWYLKKWDNYEQKVNGSGRNIGEFMLTEDLFVNNKYQIEFSFYRACVDSAKFLFYQINEDYYNYQQSINAYNTAKIDPFSKPVTRYSNMSHGMGIWYAYYFEEIMLGEIE